MFSHLHPIAARRHADEHERLLKLQKYALGIRHCQLPELRVAWAEAKAAGDAARLAAVEDEANELWLALGVAEQQAEQIEYQLGYR